jgi:hypothetical protein
MIYRREIMISGVFDVLQTLSPTEPQEGVSEYVFRDCPSAGGNITEDGTFGS